MNKKLQLLSNPMVNLKAKKNLALNVHSYFLSLAPSDISGHNVCPMANKISQGEDKSYKSHCSSVCVAYNGMGSYPNVIKARIRKTKLFFDDRQRFMALLISDIEKAIIASKEAGYIPTFRLNAYSDIRWELMRVNDVENLNGYRFDIDRYNGKNIFEIFPNITFYDYTKLSNRKPPSNYHLTVSYFGNELEHQRALNNGFNVAMVFDTPKGEALPEFYDGKKVVDGDKTDLRTPENDGINSIVGLRFKGSKANKSALLDSFVVRA